MALGHLLSQAVAKFGNYGDEDARAAFLNRVM
jgi:hypothetical protein